jgi:hypothetical protein
MALSFLELTSQRPLFEICDGVIDCVLLCYTHSLFVAANPVLCYFLSMLCGVCCRVLTSSILEAETAINNLGECRERGVVEHACLEPNGLLGPHDICKHMQQHAKIQNYFMYE